MITISVCMIVKDEQDVLARCLDCAGQVVDEIIVVDTGSEDRTKVIAAEHGALVFDFPWIQDFSAARNFSFSKATMDYCMWLDADDVLLPEDIGKLRALKETLDPSTDMVMLRYNTGFDQQGRPVFSYYRERLVKNRAGYRWAGAVHEAIAPSGRVVYRDIAVTHRKDRPGDPDRNLKIFEKLLSEGKRLQPRERFYYARELYYHAHYKEAAMELEGFLEDSGGWVENKIDACKILGYCYEGLKQEPAALRALLRSMEFDSPRAEICCELGRHFMGRQQFKAAVFWYRTATACGRDDKSGGFVENDCYDYLPYIQLCVCYDRLGERALAEECNRKAGEIKPKDAAYLYNLQYFQGLRRQEKVD